MGDTLIILVAVVAVGLLGLFATLWWRRKAGIPADRLRRQGGHATIISADWGSMGEEPASTALHIPSDDGHGHDTGGDHGGDHGGHDGGGH